MPSRAGARFAAVERGFELPELPDVEIYREYIAATSLHRKITRVELRSASILEGISRRRLKETLEGRRFESAKRHGKHLFVSISGRGFLALHFGMTGTLKYFKDLEKDTEHDRMRVSFSNGYHLAYDCRRKLGRVGLAEDIERFREAHGLGPDALDDRLGFEEFLRALEGSRAAVKSTLMDQKRIAGIGNVYSDEILFQSGVRPGAKTRGLGEERLQRVYRSMRHVLLTAVERRADPGSMPASWITPRRGKDARCPNCGGELEKIRVSGRSAYFCPKDQQG